jgi:N4-gp56 family major capsid protein
VAVVAIDIFIPEVWSARLQRHLDKKLIYAQPTISNREWEGEIAEAGDTVHINKIGDPTILTYVPGVNMQAAEEPDGTTQTLTVDQFKAFNVAIDDVNAAQVKPELLDAFAQRAGIKMAQTIDAFVANLMSAGATTAPIGTDEVPVEVRADGSGDFTPYELAVLMEQRLAEQNAPDDSRWIAVDPAFEAQVRLDPNFIKASEIAAQFVRNGVIGMISGFEILRTTGVPTSPGSGGGTHVPNRKIIAGAGNYSTTFANQVTEMKAYEPELRFADAVKGLEVYGAKVLEPETLVQAHVAK